jgi:hypothetical protein
MAIIDFPTIHAQPTPPPAKLGASVSDGPFQGDLYWEVTTRNGMALLTYKPTLHLLTVDTVYEAWELTQDPAKAFCTLVARARPERAETVWAALHDHLHRNTSARSVWADPRTNDAADDAILALESMPTLDGPAVFRCRCGGYLTELGVTATSRPSIRTAPLGYRHLDACPDCYQHDAIDRAACRLYAEQHPAWTYETRCQDVAPADCRDCRGGLRVDQTVCEYEGCCGSDDHCKAAR